MLQHQNPPGSRTRDQSPPGSRTRVQNPPGSQTRDQNPSGSQTRDQSPPGSRTRVQNPPGSWTRDQSPPGSRTRDQSPSGSRTRDQSPPGSQTRDQSPPGSWTRDQNPSGSQTRDQSPPGSWTRDQSPPGSWTRVQSPPGSWTRVQGAATSCVFRLLGSRRRSLWIFFALLVVCVALQSLVARQVRTEPVSGLPRGLWENLHEDSSDISPDPQRRVSDPQPGPLVPRPGPLDPRPPGPLDPRPPGPLDPRPPGPLDPRLPGPLVPRPGPLDPRPPGPLDPRPPGPLVPRPPGPLDPRPPGPLDPRPPGPLVPRPPGPLVLQSPTETIIQKTASCHPKSHIVFLKTHKTASSSVLNILYRYGESRNLTFALPVNGHSQLFYPFLFSAHFVEGVRSRTINHFSIMCNHMRFRKSEVQKVMPSDSFYFSIVRHPAAMMESIFMYYKSIAAFRDARSLDDFLDDVLDGRRRYDSSASDSHYAHNLLAFDFGLNNHVADKDVEAGAGAAIAAIERDFYLILVSEYFEESMVLLKHALCWSLDDVVSFKLNARSERTRRRISTSTADKVQRWNGLDWRIYRHFNQTFWHKVQRLVGRQQLAREVAQLRALRAALAQRCLKDGGAVDPNLIRDAGFKPFQYGAAEIQGYNLKTDMDTETKTTCERLITPELQYTDQIYRVQFPDHQTSRPLDL